VLQRGGQCNYTYVRRGREPEIENGEVGMSLLNALLARLRSEQGQTFVEYALILAVVVVGVLLAVTWAGLGTAIQTAIDAVSAAV
jgi:Flp pilus assembly pilin Flp